MSGASRTRRHSEPKATCRRGSRHHGHLRSVEASRRIPNGVTKSGRSGADDRGRAAPVTRSRQRCARELRTVGRSRPPMQCTSTAVTLASRAGLLVLVPERASGRRGGVSLPLSHVLSDRTGARRLGLALALVDLALRYGQGDSREAVRSGAQRRRGSLVGGFERLPGLGSELFEPELRDNPSRATRRASERPRSPDRSRSGVGRSGPRVWRFRTTVCRARRPRRPRAGSRPVGCSCRPGFARRRPSRARRR
jgi:hypothetical protein